MRASPLSLFDLPFGPAILVSIALAASPAAAAPQVYADPIGTCGGQTPCFTTISDAVANAGPAPATVGVFPGTYAENVDLSTMGAAISGSAGPLTVQALDATGSPAPSGVTIAPAAGPALTTGPGTPFPGSLALRGLAVTSPDATAMGVIVDGDLTIEDLLAENSPQIGAVAVADGNLAVERATLQGNGAAGLIAAASGQAVLRDLVADQNGATGIAAQAEADLLLERIDADANGDGLEAASCSALTAIDVTLDNSTATGGTLEAGTPNCAFVGTTRDPALEGFPLSAFESRPAGAARGAGAPSITASNVISQGHGDYGLAIVSVGGPATVNNLRAFDNLGVGMGLLADALVARDLQAIGNRTGILAQADTVDALRVDVSDSLPSTANPPLDGSGLVVVAASAVLDEVQSGPNPEIGLLIGQPAPGTPVVVEVLNSRFDGNRIGVAATADVPMALTADALFVENNASAGMIVSNIGQGDFAQILADGNPVGLVLDVVGSARVERSQFTANGLGVGLTVAASADASVACSDFIDNTTGLQLDQGDAADASANYWGNASGPTHPGNPNGTGDPVVDADNGGSGIVGYTPFLSAAATDDDCAASVPPPVAVPVPTLGPTGLALLVLLMGMTALLASIGRRSP